MKRPLTAHIRQLATAVFVCGGLLTGVAPTVGSKPAHDPLTFTIQMKTEFGRYPYGAGVPLQIEVKPDQPVFDPNLLPEVTWRVFLSLKDADGKTITIVPLTRMEVAAGRFLKPSLTRWDAVIPSPADNRAPTPLTVQVLVRDSRTNKLLDTSTESTTITWARTPGTPGQTWSDVKYYRTASTGWTYAKWVLILAAAGTGYGAACATAAKAYGIWTVVLGTAASVADSNSSADTTLGSDPSDPNFTQTATVVVPAPPRIPPATGLNGAMVTASNALSSNAAEVSGVTTAVVTSLNRAEGAAQAKNSVWENRQLALAAGFARRDAALLGAEPALLARLRQTMTAAGIGFSLSAAATEQIEEQVVAHGLPASLSRMMLSAGVDPGILNRMTSDLWQAPAQPGPIRLPDMLTDPPLITAITQEAAALEHFAATAAQGISNVPAQNVPDITGAWISKGLTFPTRHLVASGSERSHLHATWGGLPGSGHENLHGVFDGSLSGSAYTGDFVITELSGRVTGTMTFLVVNATHITITLTPAGGSTQTISLSRAPRQSSVSAANLFSNISYITSGLPTSPHSDGGRVDDVTASVRPAGPATTGRNAVPAVSAGAVSAASGRQFAAGTCPSQSAVPTPTPPSSNGGDLVQDGPITVTLSPPSQGTTVDASGARSLGGSATLDTPFGKGTYTWNVPARITRAGVPVTLNLTADAGRAGNASNLEVELWLAGEVDTVCPPSNTDCAHIQAFTTSGKTITATTTFTVKAENYSQGRTDPVLLKIGCSWGGPTITIPYRIIQ